MPQPCPPEEKRNRMRLLRQIVKEHNVQRWIRSFLEAMPEAEAAGSKRGASDSGFQYTFKPRRDETMPGVALVATALQPKFVRAIRLEATQSLGCSARPQAKIKLAVAED